MPPHHPYNHMIDLENDQMLLHSHIYPLSGTELGILHEFLDDMLENGFIQSSNSPGGAPVLFAKKKDGTLHLVLTFGTSAASLRRIATQFPWSPTLSTNWELLRSTPSSTYERATTMFALHPVMNGKQPSEHITVPLNSWSCLWGSPMPQLCFSTS